MSGEDQRECNELRGLLRRMTVEDTGVIRPAIPLVSIHRLPKGQIGYKGHCIAVLNDASIVARSLPRSADNMGLQIVVDHGRRENALQNSGVVRACRIRANLVRRILELLL